MRLRRIACLLLGAWLTGTILIGWVAAANFSAVDRVLSAAPGQIQKVIAAMDPNHARMYLRYLVAVENADYFLTWELVEFALLLALAAVLVADRNTRLLVVAPVAAILLVAFQHFRLTPEIVWAGESMVLAAGSATAADRDRFSVLHRLYGGVEIFKLLIAVALSIWLVTRSSRRRGRRSFSTDDAAETIDRRFAG